MMKGSTTSLIASILLSFLLSPVSAFTPQSIFQSNHQRLNNSMSSDKSDAPSLPNEHHPYCDLPGDPSLMITTNVNLNDSKSSILLELSKLVAASTGKPESYVAISITDNASMVFGGSDAPLALGVMYSLGAINKENNSKVQCGVTDILEKFGVTEDRIYINFFDMPRECVGWNRRTFAG